MRDRKERRSEEKRPRGESRRCKNSLRGDKETGKKNRIERKKKLD